MPIYEYVCHTCGTDFEEIQKFSDPPLTTHDCSKDSRIERKLSLAAFQLKGGGWYSEGYGGGAAPKESGSSDSKPAASKPAGGHSHGGGCGGGG